MTQKELLKINNLETYFAIENEKIKAVDGISFNLYEGETLGIVGESGSGKSVACLSILRLIPDPPGRIANGEIFFQGKDLLKMSYDEIRMIRGNKISMIFQEPMTSLNPVFTIGDQIMESIILHKKASKEEACRQAVRMLELVGIPSPDQRIKDYPHQFSGGMRQRVMIAMALSCDPHLLIADEPTTALDVTIQAQIIELMKKIKNKREQSAIILITHNLSVVAETCGRVIVMYCGKIQEISGTVELFRKPLHPYTIGLLHSIPSYDYQKKRLYNIPGNVPSGSDIPKGCSFSTRCSKKMKICIEVIPELIKIGREHYVRCHLYS
jgi:peptide/nickel transport system ATP-binding protein